MARQSPTPTARVSGWGPDGNRRLVTSAQFAEMRRKLAEVEARLRQLTVSERERRR